jgi:hypothetical protein
MNNPGKQATLGTSHRTKKNNKITQKALKDYQNGPITTIATVINFVFHDL